MMPRVRLVRSGQSVRSECGSVTVETALALPALVLVLATMLWAIVAVTGQLRCIDAARVAARAIARGDSVPDAVAAANRLAPPGADVRVRRDGDLVRVDVSADVGVPIGGTLLPAITVSGDAAVAAELP